MTTINRLKKDYDHKNFGTPRKHCATCNHFKHEEAYEDIEGVEANLCRKYRDEEDGGVIILQNDYGVCSGYE